jgi:hypothetical protein
VFGEPGEDKEIDNAYSNLSITLNLLDIRVNLPQYIPDGFVFDTIEPAEPTEFANIFAWFVRGGDEFHIRVKKVDATTSLSEANDEEQSEVYKGQFLIASNMQRTVALWYQGIYELSIHGNLTYEEMTQILDSI